jgi:DNA-binding IclR family transcriptional regulator
MQELARKVGQSCHMAVASGAEMVVVAHVETPGLLGFGVRLGYRRPLVHSASGLVLLAFHPGPARAEMLRASGAAGVAFDAEGLDARLGEVRASGRMMMPSPMLTAITDVSAPILQNGGAVAALTMPFVDGAAAMLALPEAADTLAATATAISAAITATP